MYYFIINPHSRSGHGLDIWRQAEKMIVERGIPYQSFFTEYTGHAQKIAREICELSIPCILTVVGGDGTLNEVINGLADTNFTHITLGYIPTGSGNDFARGLGMTKDLTERVQAILSPSKCISVDIGCSKTSEASRYFLVSSGIGYDADICRTVMVSPLKKALNKIHLGKLSYVLVALKLLIEYKACPVKVRLDKKELLSLPRFYFLAGMNMKYEGGGVKSCPNAQCHDGLLDICLVGDISKLKILALFSTVFWGKHTKFKGIHILRGKEIEIISKNSLPVHCDGESLGTSLKLTIVNTCKQINVILQ